MCDESEVLAYLSRSDTRVAALQRLATEGGCQRATLVADLGVSDRTIKRALADFEKRGWVAHTSPGYGLTALGETVLETYESAVESIDVAQRLEPFLRRIPADVCDVPVAALADAEVIEATDSDPNAPMERALGFRREADRLRELSSIVTKESASQLRDRVENGDIETVEVVLERDVVQTIGENPEYRKRFRETAAKERVSVYVYEGVFPFLLALTCDRVVLGATDGKGYPTVTVATDSAAAVDWAETTYDRFRTDAVALRSYTRQL